MSFTTQHCPVATFSRTATYVLSIAVLFLAMISTVEAAPLSTRGNQNSTPSKCPGVDDILKHISGKGHSGTNSIYWSYPGSPAGAKQYATKVKGIWIYDVVSDTDIATWGAACSPQEKNLLWTRASYAFALHSTGTAYVLTSVNNPAPANAVWTNFEYPVLKASGKVSTIMLVDSATNKVSQLWNSANAISQKPPMPHKP